ncbi:MAG: galactofuranose transport system permease protein [Verrucomicrobiota bacterium]|nr:galactofuranose transport system permease protein [Verrucomicrobiota bacterium]
MSSKPDPVRAANPVRWPLIGLAALVLLNAVFNPAFLKITVLDGNLYGTPIDILVQGSRTMLVALGMTLVIATGGIDLSVGSVVAISGAVCGTLLVGGHGLAVTLAAALAAGLLAGGINGLLIARLGLQPIVATLILMVAGRGVAQLIVDGQVVIIANPTFEYLANGFFLSLPVSPLLVGAMFVLTHLALRQTAVGLFIEAVGDNEKASRFAGLAAARIKALAYVFCGGCAGLAGILTASNIRAADAYRAGENMELDAIFAVVVGGTALTGGRFLILGTAIGALLIQTLTTTMYNLGVPPAVAPVPKALLIIGVSLLQSERIGRWLRGLWPKKEAS